ncbi:MULTISPECIES: ABC transporter substrate-binding protein [unclassified Beijerinckia]|uniref:ABC transporter substrate-binding protein n=1 Tax=unclassified Beijerinckia TaxID=2638183 RepID=UPI00089BA684|nr:MULTISPECIES: ABC transporter substrate-binding protein [unclassified Beijerinckia]MDH7794589.1 iron complex transport system substrate-binding protein [Beijerinckia sp. GAS462]SEB67680.1 iron complex transport system substrate-binding protein [Beijerinckia sp. 28-YEA-48]
MPYRSHIFAAAVSAVFCQSVGATEVTDQRGQSLSFDKPAARAIFLPMPAASTYMAINRSEHGIAGMNASSAVAMRDGILGKLFPGYAKIATNITLGAGTAANVESILALRPDAVFQWAAAGDDALAPLERTGLKVLGMRYGSQEDMAGYIAMMGQVAGKPERAQELVARQETQRRQIEAALAGVASQERPRVLYLARASDTFRVAGKKSYNDFTIRLAGGENIAADTPSSTTVTIEQILTWNPQVVLLGNFDTVMPADLYADPRWQGVEAVRSRKVYRMPLGGYRWDPPSQESALTWIWLADLLHPQRAGIDLRVSMRGWFDFLYGYALSDDEIDTILFAPENRRSAGYDRLLVR